MSRIRLSFAFVLLIIFSFGGLAYSQPHISGAQSGVLGPGTYIVDGSIQVQSGQSLTIQPGTEFLHTGSYEWSIMGTLVAEGTETDSIKFLRQQPIDDHRWGGLRFQPGANPGSSVSYCVIEYCYHNYIYYFGAGIYNEGVNMSITHCRLSNCESFADGGAIYCGNVRIEISDCLIINNQATNEGNGGGICLYNCNQALISNNIVAFNTCTST